MDVANENLTIRTASVCRETPSTFVSATLSPVPIAKWPNFLPGYSWRSATASKKNPVYNIDFLRLC